jgi:hypothetical protein
MDTSNDRTSALQRAVFEDGLGKRHHAVTPGGEPLEVLELRYELSTDACEAALRERVGALTGVQSACFARVRGVQRINQNTSKLFVLSERVNGARLSSVLAVARQPMVPLNVNASLCLIRQLVSAIALLHEKLPNVAHGAIAPERIIVTPESRLVVADQSIGAALGELHYTHDRYWKELRVPMPEGPEATFDQRTDVMQIGTIALELLLGRQIDCVEYPDLIDELTERAWRLNANAAGRPLSVPLRVWLLRMLQIDPKASFTSVGDAWEELEAVLGGGMGASFAALEAVMTDYARKVAAAAAVTAASAHAETTPASAPAPAAHAPVKAAPVTTAPVTTAPVAAPIAATPIPSDRIASVPATPKPVAPVAVAPPSVEPSIAPAPVALNRVASPVAPTPIAPTPIAPTPVAAPVAPAPVASAGAAPATVSPFPAPAPKPSAPKPVTEHAAAPTKTPAVPPAAPRLVTPAIVTAYEASLDSEPEPEAAPQHSTPSGRGRWIAAAAVLVLVVTAGALFGKRLLVPSAAAEAPGTLVVSTTPAGVAVIVDGHARGVTPLTLELAPGSHELKLAPEGAEARIIPFTVTPGSTVAQTIELPKATPSTGQLTIRTDPPGARVTIDGAANGTTPVTIDGLTPGTHSVALANDVSSVTQEVTVEAGTTASLVVPMSAPQGVPVSGWISVSAPSEVQVYEDSRLLGTSESDRIMVSAGKHEFMLVNDALAYRTTRSVVVSPGKVSAIRLEFPKGSMALNAQPWAEVWVDGERIGETPIGNIAVAVGTHEVIFRHPQFGEQVVRATVTATAPARVSVDMRKR